MIRVASSPCPTPASFTCGQSHRPGLKNAEVEAKLSGPLKCTGWKGLWLMVISMILFGEGSPGLPSFGGREVNFHGCWLCLPAPFLPQSQGFPNEWWGAFKHDTLGRSAQAGLSTGLRGEGSSPCGFGGFYLDHPISYTGAACTGAWALEEASSSGVAGLFCCEISRYEQE